MSDAHERSQLEAICAALSLLASAPLLSACTTGSPAPESTSPADADPPTQREACADGSCGSTPASFGSQRCSGYASCAGQPSVDCRRAREGM